MGNFFAVLRLGFMTVLIAILSVIYALMTFAQFFVQPTSAKANWANIANVWSRLFFTWKAIFNDKIATLKEKRAQEQAANKVKLSNQASIHRLSIRPYATRPTYSYYEPEELLLMMLGAFYFAIPVIAISSAIYSAIVYTVYIQNSIVVQPESPVVQVKEQVFEETEFDTVERELCPCTPTYKLKETIFTGADYNALTIVDGAGEMRFSNKWTIKPTSFKPLKGAQNFKVLSTTGPEHRITFEWKDDRYTVNADQPFRLAQDGYFTYKYNIKGGLMVVESTEAEFIEIASKSPPALAIK